MEYVYAVLLLHHAGKEINEDNLKSVLEAAGVNVDDAKVKALVSALEGIDIDEAISKATFVPTAAPTVTTTEVKEEEEKKEEEKKEEEEEKAEEEALEGLGALFG